MGLRRRAGRGGSGWGRGCVGRTFEGPTSESVAPRLPATSGCRPTPSGSPPPDESPVPPSRWSPKRPRGRQEGERAVLTVEQQLSQPLAHRVPLPPSHQTQKLVLQFLAPLPQLLRRDLAPQPTVPPPQCLLQRTSHSVCTPTDSGRQVRDQLAATTRQTEMLRPTQRLVRRGSLDRGTRQPGRRARRFGTVPSAGRKENVAAKIFVARWRALRQEVST